jgi:hypothetical protein
VYLHSALDLWVQQWRTGQAHGDVVIVRYADDFVMGFQHRSEAERFLSDLKQRLQAFGLSLHPEKTRLIEFGRFAASNRRDRGQGKPDSCDFLGCTHSCSTRRKDGGFTIRRQTTTKRLRGKLQQIKDLLKRAMHAPVAQVAAYLQRVVQGYFNYHAVPGNGPVLDVFRTQVIRAWLRSLRRRSHKHKMNWARFSSLARQWIPRATIRHPYPNVRFAATHPR